MVLKCCFIFLSFILCSVWFCELCCVQANLAIQENRLNAANNELSKAEAQLAEKQAEFDKVKAKCDAAMKEKQVCVNLKNIVFFV